MNIYALKFTIDQSHNKIKKKHFSQFSSFFEFLDLYYNNRRHDIFRSSKVREEKPRFLRGLVHYNASIPQLVKVSGTGTAGSRGPCPGCRPLRRTNNFRICIKIPNLKPFARPLCIIWVFLRARHSMIGQGLVFTGGGVITGWFTFKPVTSEIHFIALKTSA